MKTFLIRLSASFSAASNATRHCRNRIFGWRNILISPSVEEFLAVVLLIDIFFSSLPPPMLHETCVDRLITETLLVNYLTISTTVSESSNKFQHSKRSKMCRNNFSRSETHLLAVEIHRFLVGTWDVSIYHSTKFRARSSKAFLLCSLTVKHETKLTSDVSIEPQLFFPSLLSAKFAISINCNLRLRLIPSTSSRSLDSIRWKLIIIGDEKGGEDGEGNRGESESKPARKLHF